MCFWFFVSFLFLVFVVVYVFVFGGVCLLFVLFCFCFFVFVGVLGGWISFLALPLISFYRSGKPTSRFHLARPSTLMNITMEIHGTRILSTNILTGQ